MTTIRYWAAAKAAAGIAQEELPGNTLEELLERARDLHGARLSEVFRVCSFLVDEHPVGERPHAEVDLTGADQVDVLPPFAGG